MTHRHADPFCEDALYRLDSDSYDDDLGYWSSLLAMRRPRRMLELGCGSARLLLPMTQAGIAIDREFRAVGLDISADHIAAAAERLSSQPLVAEQIDLVTADMSSFDLRSSDGTVTQRFDLVFIAHNGLAFLTEQDAQLGCLASACHHLAPGGALAIDLIVPQLSYLALSEKGAPLRMGRDLAHPAPGVRRLLRFDSERYDIARQVEFDTYVYEIHTTDGNVERRTADLAWKMVFPSELELLMRNAGLRVVERYGDYERRPFDRHSGRYLWLAERAE